MGYSCERKSERHLKTQTRKKNIGAENRKHFLTKTLIRTAALYLQIVLWAIYAIYTID